MTLPKPFSFVSRNISETRDGNPNNGNGSSSDKSFLASRNSIRRRSASVNSTSVTMSKVCPVLKELAIPEEFEIIKTLCEGTFTKVLLVKKQTDRLVLKVIAQESTCRENFLQEVSYNYFLSPHPNIVKSFNVSFIWEDCYVFAMEQAPFGNLYKFLKNGSVCLPESQVKLIANQVASALEFMHSMKLVHRDVKPENVLVFKQNFTQIKLCDFGSTKPEKMLVSKTMETSASSCAPEICQLVVHENYYTHSSADVWQVGILLFVCLTGSEPWDRADISDPGFTEYTDWLRRKSLRVPEPFLAFTPRLIRLLKRLLEPKSKKRCEIREIYKYLEDDWLCKMHRSYSFKRGALERKSSSSTSRSRSTNNASFRKRSIRITPDDSKVNRKNGEDFDKRFVQQRIGRWVLEAATTPPVDDANTSTISVETK
ncbi:unnamed protein product [Orchesella dallaii]|uniref:Protein kinase domain-containing protein n=1 Tax=Orchesella dallaii TaxID=48710 RepID=A0ABP1RDX4_9HEXA